MKILINRSDALGDTLLTLPLAQKIKQHSPHAHITFLVSARVRPMLQHLAYIDQVEVLPAEAQSWKERWQRWRFLNNLFRHGRFTAYLFVGGQNLPSCLAWLWRVPVRGGVLSKWPQFIFLNKGLRQKRSRVESHEVEYNLQLLQALDINEPLELSTVDISLQVTPLEKNLARQQLQQLGWDGLLPFIVVHPGMTGHTLNWPVDYYGQLIRTIVQNQRDIFIFVSYTPSDFRYIDPLQQQLQGIERVIFIDGAPLGLRNFMGMIAQAQLFIGPSTGPTHMAHALGVPVVSFYSPILVQSARRWAPYGGQKGKTTVLGPPVNCPETFQCAGEKCPAYPCMHLIPVSQALDSCYGYLQLKVKKNEIDC